MSEEKSNIKEILDGLQEAYTKNNFYAELLENILMEKTPRVSWEEAEQIITTFLKGCYNKKVDELTISSTILEGEEK